LPADLPALVEKIPDAASARAAEKIASGIARRGLTDDDDEKPLLARAATGCALAAIRTEYPIEVRVSALGCADALARALGDAAPPLARDAAAALAADPSADVRRAAVETLRPAAAWKILVARTRDPDAGVAASAGAAICAEDPDRALRDAGRDRLAALKPDDPGDEVRIHFCLDPQK
jgi:hypothetical protein